MAPITRSQYASNERVPRLTKRSRSQSSSPPPAPPSTPRPRSPSPDTIRRRDLDELIESVKKLEDREWYNKLRARRTITPPPAPRMAHMVLPHLRQPELDMTWPPKSRAAYFPLAEDPRPGYPMPTGPTTLPPPGVAYFPKPLTKPVRTVAFLDSNGQDITTRPTPLPPRPSRYDPASAETMPKLRCKVVTRNEPVLTSWDGMEEYQRNAFAEDTAPLSFDEMRDIGRRDMSARFTSSRRVPSQRPEITPSNQRIRPVFKSEDSPTREPEPPRFDMAPAVDFLPKRKLDDVDDADDSANNGVSGPLCCGGTNWLRGLEKYHESRKRLKRDSEDEDGEDGTRTSPPGYNQNVMHR
ncbi:uncharacterized protein K452DRAFT_311990 [Aplosporella prunicola CBS 121167]|uniref:Uncharacterized protein n=1 Tax=Aplosporella prunicola CBS 121167 TaxID=1176127 RepID=A0A6A6B1D3_9PEZI|nr:uncharacterized protein K452DRAFT_311990 [Aplosporella prunicola CBS 121167]KAF2137850.1 hypothetical protein K452DRAFT_311990 [Aplosporella prunicola CBS 121167]